MADALKQILHVSLSTVCDFSSPWSASARSLLKKVDLAILFYARKTSCIRLISDRQMGHLSSLTPQFMHAHM